MHAVPAPEILNLPNRRVRTRMHGGAGGGSRKAPSSPDSGRAARIPPMDGTTCLDHAVLKDARVSGREAA